jgi:hypothetical protein
MYSTTVPLLAMVRQNRDLQLSTPTDYGHPLSPALGNPWATPRVEEARRVIREMVPGYLDPTGCLMDGSVVGGRLSNDSR